MRFLVFLILIFGVYYLLNKFIFSKFKMPKFGAITLFTGGVKSGKSAVSLCCAIKQYKRNHRKWNLRCFFIKFLNFFKKEKFSFPEEPLFYSNIPVATLPYCELTTDHFLRKIRFNYKSVVFIDEASLVADSMLIKDKQVNSELLLFFKLFGHETHGGNCFVNSHCISDLHFALKRTTSDYFYINSLSNYFILLCANCREERYSDDGTTINTYDKDIDESMKRLILRKSIFKKYDCYAFSSFTDYLSTRNIEHYYKKYDDLKAYSISSFREEFKNLEVKNEEKNS